MPGSVPPEFPDLGKRRLATIVQSNRDLAVSVEGLAVKSARCFQAPSVSPGKLMPTEL